MHKNSTIFQDLISFYVLSMLIEKNDYKELLNISIDDILEFAACLEDDQFDYLYQKLNDLESKSKMCMKLSVFSLKIEKIDNKFELEINLLDESKKEKLLNILTVYKKIFSYDFITF